MTCTFAEFLDKPNYLKLGKKQYAAKLTHPDRMFRQCREAVYGINTLCFYHNILAERGMVIEKA